MNPEVGDLVRVNFGNQSTVSQITEIEGSDLYISSEENPNEESKLYLENGEYGVWGTDLDYQIEFLNDQLLTGDPNVDLQILLDLDDQTLNNLCLTNKYAAELCSNEDLWRDKLINRFDENSLRYKPENLTLRQFYNELIRTPLTPESVRNAKLSGKDYLAKWLIDHRADPLPGYSGTINNGIFRILEPRTFNDSLIRNGKSCHMFPKDDLVDILKRAFVPVPSNANRRELCNLVQQTFERLGIIQ